MMKRRIPLLLCFLMLVGTAVAQSIAAAGCITSSAAANGAGDHCGGILEPHSWTVQQTPTVEHPFVMFHQRKAGGSSWRSVMLKGIVAETKKKNGTFVPHGRREMPSDAFIPCYTHSCKTFTLPSPPRPAYSAIAGHFSWGNIHMFLPPGMKHGHVEGLRGLTSFRDPVTRVVSCLRWCFPRQFHNANSFARLSVDQLRQFLLHRRSSLGSGCGNEPIRMLSGYSDDSDIDKLGLSQNRQLAEALVERSKRHILASVVCTVLERPLETFAVVSHYFPWMHVPKELPRANTNHARDGSKTGGDLLSEEQRQMILELNWPEVEIYDFANRILSREYNSLTGSR